MSITPIKALLFLAGGSAAAAATAYVAGVLDPYLPAQPAAIGVLHSPAPAPGEAPAATVPPAVVAVPPAAAPPDAAVSPPSAAPELVAPTFDVVRVESGGSVVVAGKAMASSKIEVLAGSNLIGETVAGVDGDFAIVLDKPLKPGNYQLVLRSTAPGNVVAMSVETAILSIPEDASGEVLAMVEEPGKPAEVISMPKPKEQPAPAAAEQAAVPPAGTPPAPPAAASAGDAPATPPAAEAPAAVAPAPAEPKPGEQAIAAVTPEPAPAEAPAAPVAVTPKVSVEAVEIEGRKIFVAGIADPGRTVRGYANEILLGDAKASPDGRFLIEAERDLAVGNYIIRIDALDAKDGKVIARAAVPFEREPGETIAAIAAPAPAAPAAAEKPAAPASGTPPLVSAETPAAPVESPAAPAAQTPPAANEAPAAEAPAASAEAPVAPTSPTMPATAGAPPAAAGGTPAAVAAAPSTAAPGTPAAVAEAPAAATPPATAEAPAAKTPSTVEAPATTGAPAGEVAAAASPVQPAPPAVEVPEVTAPKLQSVDSAVIIRRGDTLWRISRRVYGLGVRYSTIYLANQTQIEDPDRIWPGQVFKVPEKSTDGQPADLTRMGKQITTVE